MSIKKPADKIKELEDIVKKLDEIIRNNPIAKGDKEAAKFSILIDCRLWQALEWKRYYLRKLESARPGGNGADQNKEQNKVAGSPAVAGKGQPELDKKIEETGNKVKDFLNALSPLDPAKIKASQFPSNNNKNLEGKPYTEEVAKKLICFYADHALLIESLRARLISLYTHCLWFEEKAGNVSAETAQEIAQEIFQGSDGTGTRQPPIIKELLLKYLQVWNLTNGITVTPDWLKGWFFLTLLESKALEAYLKQGDSRLFSTEEILSFFKHFATIALFVLHWIRNGGNLARFPFADVEGGSKAHLEAIFYALSEYTHIDLGLTRRAKMFATLKEVWQHEAVLYTIRETYRDHINHMLETCLLGMLILKIKDTTHSLPLFKYSAPSCSFSDRKQLFRNWILAAMMHDVGYAVNILQMAPKQVEFIDAPSINEFRKTLESQYQIASDPALNTMLLQLGREMPWLTPDKINSLDHGVVSALFLLYLVRDGDKPDETWREDIAIAMQVSAQHNLKRHRVSYRENPLAFLLILCDHLQEWDRPLVKGEEIRYSLAVNLTGKEWAGVETKSIVRYLEVDNVKFNSNGKLLMAPDQNLTFTMHFDQYELGEYHPALTWTQAVYDLQELLDAPHNLKLTLSHPCSGTYPEMDLFQSFLRTRPEFSDLQDWVARSRAGRDWFTYKFVKGPEVDPDIEDNPGTERISFEKLHLEFSRIQKEIILPKLPSGYIPAFIQYKQDKKII